MNGSILSRPWFGYLCALAFNSWRVDAALSRQEQRRGREPEEAIDELIARTSPECAQELQQLKDDLTAEVQQIEMVVGENTSRLYSLVIDSTRRSSGVRTELTVDEYEAPVEIQPPASVLPPKPSSSSRCVP